MSDEKPQKPLKPKLLCVDDEAAVLEALTRVFRPHFSVLTATSPNEALGILQNNNDIAIVLSDYRMPEMNGVDFLKNVKLMSPTSVRAILSGQVDLSELSEAINSAEIHRFILKPWDNEYLIIQMKEALLSHATLVEKERLLNLAVTDPVTQLTNHRYFQERLRELTKLSDQHEAPFSLIMADVDHFKSFNDRYGHPEGDRLLLSVAQRISHVFPETGQASRYGGEEFGILLENTDAGKAKDLAEVLRKSLESSPFSGPYNRPAYVTISLGVAVYPDHGKDAPDLLEAADRALYQAKRQGRNQTLVANSSR